MKRLIYQGTLRFPYGFHTGDGSRTGLADQPLFREKDGRVALSGSSLAGVLRADLERLAAADGRDCRREPDCDCAVCRLVGPRPAKVRADAEDAPGLFASKLHVRGGSVPGEGATRIRDRVAIDRRTHTAADHRKYDLEVVDGGIEIPFELRLDDPQEDERDALEETLRRLATGWLFLGGKTASGLGRAEVTSLTRTEIDLSLPEVLIRYLLDEEPAGGSTVPLVGSGESDWLANGRRPDLGTTPAPGAWGQLRLRIELDFPLGFLVNDPIEALLSGFDHTYTRLPDGRPVLPGSALRGALRSRAEQILRTLGGGEAACDLNRKESSCHEVVEKENRRRTEAGGKPCTVTEEKERHCMACRVFGSGRLASAVKVSDFPAGETRRGWDWRQESVAIDRLTGAAADGAKFNFETRAGVTLAGEIHLEIGPHRLGAQGLGLVALVLRDLLLGDVPLGFGTAKGLNEYHARITAVDRFWLRPPEPLAGLALGGAAGMASWQPSTEPDLDGWKAVRDAVPAEVRDRLSAWVQSLHADLAVLRNQEVQGE